MATAGQEKTPAYERILAAASSLFGQQGYNGVSTRDVALAAQVNEVTIYRHYPRKRDLYMAVLTAELGRVSLRGDLLAGIAQAKDARQALERTFDLIEGTVARRPDLLRLVLFSSLELQEDMDTLLKTHLGELVKVVANYLEPWIDRGDLRCGSSRGAVLALIAIAAFHESLRRVLPSETDNSNSTFTAFAEICLGTRSSVKSGGNVFATHGIVKDETLQPG